MEIDKQRFRKTFPNLAKEIDISQQQIPISSVRSNRDTAEKAAHTQKNLDNFDPDVIDFLRRCDDKKQAEEIISYMESRCEITKKYAVKLRQQLRKQGIRSFGPKKEAGYYFNGNRK